MRAFKGELGETLAGLVPAGLRMRVFANTLRHSGLVQAQGATLEGGRIVLSGPGAEMIENEHVRKAYLGG